MSRLKLPVCSDDPQVRSLCDVAHEMLLDAESDAALLEVLDRYVGRDVWLQLLVNQFAYDIAVALEREAEEDAAQ